MELRINEQYKTMALYHGKTYIGSFFYHTWQMDDQYIRLFDRGGFTVSSFDTRIVKYTFVKIEAKV